MLFYMTVPGLQQAISQYWGYTTFRPLQREAMDAVLAGRDSIVVLPTGGGKSLCFQAPAVVRPGVARRRLAADLADEGPGRHARRQRCAGRAVQQLAHFGARNQTSSRDSGKNRYKLLYVSPERLVGEGSDSFLSMLSSIRRQLRRGRRSALHQPMGPRLPARVSPARAAAPAPSGRRPARVHGDRDRARAPRHRDAARPRRPDRVRRLLRSSQPDLSRAPARGAEEAARRGARAPSPRSRHRVLHVAPRSGCARGVAERDRPSRAALSRRAVGRRAQPPSGRLPQRARRHHRRDGGLRDGHRSLGRAVRRARRRTAIARALPAGIGPRRPRRARGRMSADLFACRLHEMAGHARAERRAQRRQPRAAPADGAVRNRHRLPPSASVGVFRRSVREGRMRRLRLLPERARTCRGPGRARAQDSVVRRARRPALRRHACGQRAARTGERAGRRPRSRSAQHVRPAPGCVERRGARLYRAVDRRGAAAAIRRRLSGRRAHAERARAAEGSRPRARARARAGSGRRARARRAPSRASRPSRGRTSIAICSSACARCASRSHVRAACRRMSSSTTRRCARWRGCVPPRSTRCSR